LTHDASPGGEGRPQAILETRDAIGLVLGLIIGAGIVKLPSLVAMFSANDTVFFGVWIAGGIISLIGALCYAELATAYPNAGGDYFFLQRAYGRRLSFLFAWARIAVVTSGPIAVLAFVFGDYASNLLRLGPHSTAIYAVLAVMAFTAINLAGVREGATTQNWLTILEVLGLVAIIIAGLAFVTPAAVPVAAATAEPKPWTAGIGMAMLFVLFTYGGWNEGAYISAELKDKRRSIVIALTVSLALVTVLYVLVNYAYYRGLGIAGMAKSQTVAADLLGAAFGPLGAASISLIVAISALTSINATVIVGARSSYALGRDWPIFRWLGHWDGGRNTPRNALLAQGAVSLALVLFGATQRDAVQAMVDYTMPVFWFFILLVGIGLFVLRVRDPGRERPFRVPLYPVTPIVFILTCAYLLYSSLAYAGRGAWVGVGVLAVGLVLLFLSPKTAEAAR